MSETLTTWGFGACFTGFFFLALWIRQVADKNLLDEIKEIKKALVGDMKSPGIITVLHNHTLRLDKVEMNCEQHHPIKT